MSPFFRSLLHSARLALCCSFAAALACAQTNSVNPDSQPVAAPTSGTLSAPGSHGAGAASVPPSASSSAAVPGSAPDGYVLGPHDLLLIRIVNMEEELGDQPYSIDVSGNLNLPRVGRVHAAGLTVEQLENDLTQRFKEYLQEPIVNITVTEFHSQPVAVLGAVERPGTMQIQGNKTLYQVISEAGGLKDYSGNTIEIARRIEYGELPLRDAKLDPTGKYSVATLNIRDVMSGKNPQDDIAVKPNDTITIPRADLIYVVGSVNKAGGFPLSEREQITALEAVSMAEGLDHNAAAKSARILRTDEVTHAHTEIPINLKLIMNGKTEDVPLKANDILYIPNNTGKVVAARALEAMIAAGTGILIYGRTF